MTTEAMWMAGGFFELSYALTGSSTTAHEIETLRRLVMVPRRGMATCPLR